MKIILTISINALALWLAAGLISGIELESGFFKILLVAIIFGIINAVVKPIVTILSIPFIIVTFGLALVVINAAMLLITDALTRSIEVDGFGAAILGALVISVVSWAANQFVRESD